MPSQLMSARMQGVVVGVGVVVAVAVLVGVSVAPFIVNAAGRTG